MFTSSRGDMGGLTASLTVDSFCAMEFWWVDTHGTRQALFCTSITSTILATGIRVRVHAGGSTLERR